MLVPWFNYNACSITCDSQGKRVKFARQHAKVRDFTSRHACLEVKFGFRQVQVCFIGGSLPVILSSMVMTLVGAVHDTFSTIHDLMGWGKYQITLRL